MQYTLPIPINWFEIYENTPTLLKNNEGVIHSNLLPFVLEAIPDSISAKFDVSEEELSRVLIAISFSEGAKSSTKGAIVYQSLLCKKGNNPFGIKGKGIKTKTNEYLLGKNTLIDSEFAKFESYTEAIQYMVRIISNKRYRKCLKATTGEELIRELQKAGYATSPTWFEIFTIPAYKKISRKDADEKRIQKSNGRFSFKTYP